MGQIGRWGHLAEYGTHDRYWIESSALGDTLTGGVEILRLRYNGGRGRRYDWGPGDVDPAVEVGPVFNHNARHLQISDDLRVLAQSDPSERLDIPGHDPLDFHFPRRDPGADLCSDSFGEKGLGV